MAYFDKYGAEFTDDKKDLKKVPKDYSGVYEIPNGTIYVYGDAFEGCSKITTIVIPKTVKNIFDDGWLDILDSCDHLSYFIVDSQNPEYFSLDGILCDKKNNIIVAYPKAKKERFTLPDDMLLTDDTHYIDVRALTVTPYIIDCIDIPDSNPNYVLKEGALYNKSMEILIKVSPKATTYEMPNTVTLIADGAFAGCTQLKKITFGWALVDVSYDGATLAEQLSDCKRLNSLIVPEFNQYYYSDKRGFVYHNDYETFRNDRLVYFPPGKRIRRCVIPSYTESIASDAFTNCTQIESFCFEKDSYGSRYINMINQDTTKIKLHAFEDTAFYSNENNWEDGLLCIDNILIRVSDDFDKHELIIPSGIDVITEKSITSPNIESIVLEEGVSKFYSSAIACPNIKTIKFPKTLSVSYLEKNNGIPYVQAFKNLEKVLIPKGMRDFFLMYSTLYSLFIEYDEEGNEHPIKPLSNEEKEFYSKIHCYFGAPNFDQYTLIKSELQKGVALSRSQIFSKLYNSGLLDILGNYYHFVIGDLMNNLLHCFKRDGITIKTIKHKNNDGKVEELYYIDSNSQE